MGGEMRRRLIVVGCMLTAACALAQTPALADAVDGTSCPDSSLRPTSEDLLARAGASTLCLMNAERAANGLAPLRWDDQLAAAARGHSADMARTGYFAHESPNGDTLLVRVRAAGYTDGAIGWSLAENIAMGSGLYSTPLETLTAWSNSPEHLEKLLAPDLVDVGIGVVPTPVDGYAGAVYTADFGARRTTQQPAAPASRLAPASLRARVHRRRIARCGCGHWRHRRRAVAHAG
jgi:uncharacterized protein YkwD